jgi:HK97 family phage portal protein
MAIISSVGSLQSVTGAAAKTPALPVWGGGASGLTGWDYDPWTYITLYQTQPHIRKCVDFIARNVAQLGIHVFRRVSDTDRARLADHQLADWLNTPTPYVTRYRLIETLLQDLGIFFNAYWLKVRERGRIALQRLPPQEIQVAGGLVPSFYRWTRDTGEPWDIPASEVVAFNGFSPSTPLVGLSPIETLRRILAEDLAATEHRAAVWRNAARIEGVVERPLAAKAWSPEQVDSFRGQWQTKFGGAAGVGAVPVLQEGMTFKPIAFSARQTEYSNVRKLTGEECAAAYHIPLPMVGFLDHATFSNITEQHKNLYQDTLGPWCEWLVQELERQLLPECEDTDRVYVEFNIAAKLQGSFEEQAQALQTLVGRPIMTANEGRARLNLPALTEPGANQLIRPLNTAPETAAPPDDLAVDEPAITAAITETWKRQAAVLGKVDDAQRAAAFDNDRWTRELAADLAPIYRRAGCSELIAQQRARRLAFIVNDDTRMLLGAGIAAFDADRKADYVP